MRISIKIFGARVNLLLLATVYAGSVLAEPSAQLAPLTADQLLRVGSIQQAELSKDGRFLALLVSHYNTADNSKGDVQHGLVTTSLDVIDLANNNERQLTLPDSETTSFAWSYASGSLAYDNTESNARSLWMWNPKTALSNRLAGVELAAGKINWCSDGRCLIVALKSKGGALGDQYKRQAEQDRNQLEAKHQRCSEYWPDSMERERFDGGLYGGDGRRGRYCTSSVIANATEPVDLAEISLPDATTKRLATVERPQNLRLSPDGRWLAYATLVGQEAGNSFRNLFSLSLVSANGKGQSRHLASEIETIRNNLDFSWSPDSKEISFTTSKLRPTEAPVSDADDRSRDNDCFIVTLTGNISRVELTERGDEKGFSVSPYRTPLWSSDGRQLYLLGSRGIWRADVGDATARLVGHLDGKKITQIVTSRNPTAVLEQSRPIYVIARDDKTSDEGIYKLELGSLHVSELLLRPTYLSGSSMILDLAAADQWLLFPSESAESPRELWLLNTRNATPRQVTHINEFYPTTKGISSSRIVDWQDHEGRQYRGALILPPNARPGERYPLIVDVYPNEPLSETVHQFGGYGSWANPLYNAQLLTTRGFAVLEADSRASPSNRMKDLAASVLPGVQKVIDMGVADPLRLGIRGQSDGGYAALAVLVSSDRFKAGMVSGGFSDLPSLYGQMHADGSHWTHSWLERADIMAGAPWEYPTRYVDNSPLFFLDRLKAPLLILHGAMDTAVNVSQADELYTAMLRLQGEVVYARYQHEGHVILRRVEFVDAADRMTSWFSSKLGGETPGLAKAQ